MGVALPAADPAARLVDAAGDQSLREKMAAAGRAGAARFDPDVAAAAVNSSLCSVARRDG